MANGIFGWSVEHINDNPSILNGRTISGSTLDGLRLENVTLSNTTFNKVEAYVFNFKNVVFENCSFINCRFRGNRERGNTTMENVTFKGGVMSNDAHRLGIYRMDWQYVYMNKVVFDGVSMHGAKVDAITGGSLTFRNMSDFKDYYSDFGVPILNAYYMQFRLDNCQLDQQASGASLGSIGDSSAADENSTIYATNSRFSGAGLGRSETKATYIDNCEFTGGVGLGGPQVMVVKNSILGIGALPGGTNTDRGDLYFVNNKYLTCIINRRRYNSGVNSKNVYFINDGMAMKSADGSNHVEPMAIGVVGGGANICDVDLDIPTFQNDIEYINLRNVKILGGRWLDLNLKGGQWENVEIHGPIEIIEAAPQFGDLKCYNVTFHPPLPNSPFSAAIQFKFTKSEQPFEWPEVHVPTLQEMGIEPD
jgi:uncharacterized protein YjbI with pentapeptide repeats